MIRFDNVSKAYGRRKVLNNIDLQLDTTARTLLIAPNGFGKSTMLNLLIGALLPSEGIISRSDQIRSAFMNEVIQYPSIPLRDILQAHLRLIPPGQLIQQHPLESWSHPERQRQSFKKLSKGMKKKFEIYLSLLEDPDLLIMDEPFEGLDVLSRETLINMLNDRAAAGKGCLVSTHNLTELARSFDDAIFIREGGQLLHLRNIRQWQLADYSPELSYGDTVTVDLMIGDLRLIRNCDTDPAQTLELILKLYKYFYERSVATY